MRKNYTKLIAALASALSVLSCAQFQAEDPQNLLPNQFVATLESTEDDGGPETKLSLSSNHTTVTWNMYDDISFVSSESVKTSVWFAETVDQNGKRALFSLLDGSSEAEAKFAVFPHNNLDNRVSGQSLVCWSFENQAGQFKDANVMVAKIVDNTLNFKHVLGIFELKVTDSKVKKIVVEGPGIAGGVLTTFGTKDSDRNVTGTEPYSKLDKITVGNVTPGTWYVAVRPGTYAAGSIVISYLDDKDTAVYTVTYGKSLTVGRKDIFAFGDISEHVGLPSTLPDGKTFNSYMKSLAGSLDNITWINFHCNDSYSSDCIKIADDVYMIYWDRGIDVFTSKSSYTANEDCWGMFDGCKNVVTIDGLQNVNTSATTNMARMFNNCYKLKRVNLTGAFTTSNVTTMGDMFYSCESLETLDLSNFNTRKLKSMSYMFEWCNSLKEVYLGKNFVIPDDCIQDETLLGCYATWYGTTEEMESFVKNLDEGSDYFSGTLQFAIDMGDAGWWSAWNVGASKPADYGYYFSWGNTTGHWKNGKNDGYSFTEIAYRSTTGYSLTSSWKDMPYFGSLWRVPSKSDFEALMTYCTTTRTTGGTKFTHKSNGNSIFIPDAAIIYESNPLDRSLYWTREYNTEYFDNQGLSFENSGILLHSFGLPLRPIAKYGDIVVTGVSLNKTSITIEVDDEVQLSATVLPSKATIKAVTWTSSNTSVATVSGTGLVSGVSAGSATITVTTDDGSFKATCKVQVTKPSILSGEFSVSSGTKVHFSQGNLQAVFTGGERYEQENYTWRFAENQYEYVGRAPGNTTYHDHEFHPEVGEVIDLLNWSGPYTHYGLLDDFVYNTSSFNDWGLLIERSNAWRTLSKKEWEYLFSLDDNSNTIREGRYAVGVTVVGKPNCVVLYPDGYDKSKVVNDGDVFAYDTIEEWKAAEKEGVVCLPAAGYRDVYNIVKNVNDRGYYWSSTPTDYACICVLSWTIDNGTILTDKYCAMDEGRSVRLVTDVK